MTCAFPAMWNANGDAMRMPRRTLWFFAGLLLIGAALAATVFAGTLRLRHRISLLTDGQQRPLLSPEGICPLSGSELIVADTGNQRLVRYKAVKDFDYQAVATVSLPQLRYPTKVQRHPQGDLWVLDRQAFRIVRLEPDGRFRGFFPPVQTAIKQIKSFALAPGGNAYLLELSGSRVQEIGPQGNRIRELSAPVECILSDLAVDLKGRLLAVDATTGTIYSAGPHEDLLKPMTASLKPYARFPSRITTDDRGRIYLSDRNGCRIVILGQDGSFLANRSTRGWKEGLLQFPGQIWIAEDTLLVADTRNHRIQVFTISE